MPRTLTIIVPCFNEEAVIEKFHRALTDVIDRLTDLVWTVLYVDDGSKDLTLSVLRQLEREDDRVRVASLSRNFGHQAALSAGLDLATTDAVLTMDCDLQHPPALIPELLEQWNAGWDIVSTIRRETADSSLLKRNTSKFFYRLINRLSDTQVPAGAADFGLLSRPAYEALRAMPETHRFLRGLVSWMGFSRTFVEFDAPPRAAGESKYTLRRMLKFASDALLSFSSAPLRLATMLGLAVTSVGFLYLAYVLGRFLFVGDLVPGWGSLAATVLFLGGVQLLCLGIVSEYVARIYEQVKGRPRYLLKYTTASTQPPPRRTQGDLYGYLSTEDERTELRHSMRAPHRDLVPETALAGENER
ncbi:MAG: glycosyltransferase family 2 protein [Planctomycetaceae bacterium]